MRRLELPVADCVLVQFFCRKQLLCDVMELRIEVILGNISCEIKLHLTGFGSDPEGRLNAHPLHN